MPLIIMFFGVAVKYMGPLVAQVLFSLGIGFVSYSGIDLMATQAQSQIMSAISGLGNTAIQLIGILQLGACLNILFSAFSTRMLMSGITGGKITKMMFKG